MLKKRRRFLFYSSVECNPSEVKKPACAGVSVSSYQVGVLRWYSTPSNSVRNVCLLHFGREMLLRDKVVIYVDCHQSRYHGVERQPKCWHGTLARGYPLVLSFVRSFHCFVRLVHEISFILFVRSMVPYSIILFCVFRSTISIARSLCPPVRFGRIQLLRGWPLLRVMWSQRCTNRKYATLREIRWVVHALNCDCVSPQTTTAASAVTATAVLCCYLLLLPLLLLLLLLLLLRNRYHVESYAVVNCPVHNCSDCLFSLPPPVPPVDSLFCSVL